MRTFGSGWKDGYDVGMIRGMREARRKVMEMSARWEGTDRGIYLFDAGVIIGISANAKARRYLALDSHRARKSTKEKKK